MDDLCFGCLSAGRNLRKLYETDFVDIYMQILSEIGVYDTSTAAIQLCWECLSALRRFHLFKHRVKSCYLAIQDCTQLHLAVVPSQPTLNTLPQPPISISAVKEDTDRLKEDADCLRDVDIVEVKTEADDHVEPETFVNNLPLHEDIAIKDSASETGDRNHPESELEKDRLRGETEEDVFVEIKHVKKKDKKKKPKVKKKPKTKTKSKTKKAPSLISEHSIDNCDADDNVSLDGTACDSDKAGSLMTLDKGKTEMGDMENGVEKTEIERVVEKQEEQVKEPPKVVKKRSREVLPDRPTCVECGKTFSSKKTYRYHMSVLHKGHNRHVCGRCNKVFHWKSNLGRHMRSHKAADMDELHCVECDKRFASIATFRQHLNISRRHVQENDLKHQCTHCHKRFRTRTSLRDHVDWDHLQRIKFTCQLCHKPFKCHTSLYVHKQNVHRDKDRKDNLCHVCGKSYQNPAKLKYHIVAMHTAQTPYQCSQCDAAFGWYSSLYRHVREVHYKMKSGQKKSKRGKKDALPDPPLDSLQLKPIEKIPSGTQEMALAQLITRPMVIPQ